MKNIVVINAISLSNYSMEAVFNGKNSYDLAIDYSNRLPFVEGVCILTDMDSLKESGNTRILYKKEWTLTKLIEVFAEISPEYDNIIYYYGDCPLMDTEIGIKMLENHNKYFAQYSFADGYPYGLSPEILNTNIIPPLLHLAGKLPEKNPVLRDSIFTLIMKDVNSFDIETEISPEDLRLYRLYLTTDTKRNFLQLKGIFSSGGTDAESITKIIKTKEELLRSLPAFFNIQISGECPQECSYCPYPIVRKSMGKQREMSVSDFDKIIKDIESSFDDAVVSISLWGEPSLHSRIDEIIERALMHKKISPVIETSGIGWEPHIIDKIIKVCEKYGKSPDWIISLDALSPDLYRELRGEGQAEAVEFAEKMISLNSENVYVQAVRMKKNEEDLEAFYKHWKKITDKIIIQKYDHFSNNLPDEKVTDLSPLERNVCWHIKRDMHILLDGSVPLCREDLKNEYSNGNVLKDGVARVWERSFDVYIKHINAQYPELCKNCDEYYTFNF